MSFANLGFVKVGYCFITKLNFSFAMSGSFVARQNDKFSHNLHLCHKNHPIEILEIDLYYQLKNFKLAWLQHLVQS